MVGKGFSHDLIAETLRRETPTAVRNARRLGVWRNTGFPAVMRPRPRRDCCALGRLPGALRVRSRRPAFSRGPQNPSRPWPTRKSCSPRPPTSRGRPASTSCASATACGRGTGAASRAFDTRKSFFCPSRASEFRRAGRRMTWAGFCFPAHVIRRIALSGRGGCPLSPPRRLRPLEGRLGESAGRCPVVTARVAVFRAAITCPMFAAPCATASSTAARNASGES